MTRTSNASARVSRVAVAAVALLQVASMPVRAQSTSYSLLKSYEGSRFFDDWSYYGHYDNLTNGDINYVNRTTTPSLTYINDAGNAIIKVDNETEVPYNEKRNSVRITTTDLYSTGNLIVLDALHVPYGCSVWPAFWTQAPDWPTGGEIDIFEGVNLQVYNRMALHTTSGCSASSSALMTGTVTQESCDHDVNDNNGCSIEDPSAVSYGEDFATNGGGVWATQFADEGIAIWFFDRASVPSDLSSGDSPDPSTWGTPVANYSSEYCDIPTYFEPQHITFTITLCGDWAGNTAVFAQNCTGTCYTDYVLDANNYDQAYFEVASVKVFTDGTGTATTSTASSGSNAASETGTSSSDSSGSSSGSGDSGSGASLNANKVGGVVSALLVLVGALMLRA